MASWSRPWTATRAPWLANSLAIAAPMPRELPVTRAIRPCKSPTLLTFFAGCRDWARSRCARRLAFGSRGVGRGHQLEEVPVGIVEVHATAAVAVVDLSRLPAAWVGVGGDLAVDEPLVAGIEGGVVDQEGDVNWSDVSGVAVVEGDVADLKRLEVAHGCTQIEAEDVGQEPSRQCLVGGWDDEVVDLDAHVSLLVDRRPGTDLTQSA